MKNLLMFFCCLTYLSGFAQTDYKLKIEQKVKTFIDLSNEAKWSEAFDMMYPKLFESVAKEELVLMMTQMVESGFDIKTPSYKLTSISDIIKHEKEDFVLVKYNADQILKMGPDVMDNETARGAMLFNLQSAFGSDNVTYKADENHFAIDADKSMYAVADAQSNEWFFVENNEEQKQLLDLLIPAAVQEKLNK